MIKLPDALSTRFEILVNTIPDSLARLHEALLPELCVTCLAPDARKGLCNGCRGDLPVNDRCCARCGLPLLLARPGRERTCGDCIKLEPAYHRAFIPWRYEFPVDRMISRYKYQGQRHYGRPLLSEMALLVDELLTRQPDRRPQLLVAAPMHRKRQRKRGFNQAAEIAEAISRQTDIPWSDRLLQRPRSARPQSGLNRKQRLSNLKGLFELHGGVPRHVALVDDVVTTGATVGTLATLLQQHGAERIEVWALARTPARVNRSEQALHDVAGDRQAGGQPG
ncbi:ComF family protein [Marinobacter bryozoorum]|uniref:ComF family protein n=1 Tax=Marinobacter bryozoorum TaxID=256324 RepID=UPI0020061154|nr:ComF family protein [Marinobacter bryozoorum]MCK7542831.1 ComF family protein [Marinobacter bryozoorum]